MSSFLPRFFMPSFLPQKNMLNNVYPSFTFSRNFGISNVFFHVAGTIETPTRSHQNGTDPIDYGFDNFVDFFLAGHGKVGKCRQELRRLLNIYISASLLWTGNSCKKCIEMTSRASLLYYFYDKKQHF